MFRFRCDSILGYAIDGRCTFKSREYRSRVEMLNLLPARLWRFWPDQAAYDHMVFTSHEIEMQMHVGWANNFPAGTLSNSLRKGNPYSLGVRDGGYIAFLTDQHGWGVALERRGDVAFSNQTCPVWLGRHYHVHFPNNPDDDGFYRGNVSFWIVNLPPEATSVILQSIEIQDYGGLRRVMIRLGEVEDFESQPLPLTSSVRGLSMGVYGADFEISQRESHSGRQSLLVRGVTLGAETR